MKFKKSSVILSFSLIFELCFALLFASCSNLSGDNSSSKNSDLLDKAVVYVYVNSKNSRTAVPAIPSDVSYVISATKGAETVEQNESNNGAYQLTLGVGDWVITANGFSGGVKIMSGTGNLSVTDNRRYSAQIPVYFFKNEASVGSVSLEINVKDCYSCNKVVISDNPSSQVSPFAGTYTCDANGIVKIEKTAVPCKDYSVILSFYDDDTPANLLTAFPEKINVRENVITNTWSKNSNELWLTDENKFVLTDSVLRKLTNSVFYVAGNLTGNSDVSDSNSGSFYSPFESLQAAVNRVVALNRTNAGDKFTIFLTGDYIADVNTEITSFINGGITEIGICSIANVKSGFELTIVSIDNSRKIVNANEKAGVFIVEPCTNTKITFENLEIIGGAGTEYGGGLNVRSSASGSGCGIYIKDCKFTDNRANGKGGAIYLEGADASVYLENENIIENNICPVGAGIYVDSNNVLQLEGKVTVYNNVSSVGSTNQNNIYLCSGAKIKLSEDGINTTSKIGITTQTKPEVIANGGILSASVVQITDGLNNLNKNCFVSDEDYFVSYDAAGEGQLTVTGGNVSHENVNTDVLFTLSGNTITVGGVNQVIEVVALKKSNPDPANPLVIENVSFELKSRGATVDSSYYTVEGNSISLSGSLIAGKYTLFIKAEYNNVVYCSEFEITANNL